MDPDRYQMRDIKRRLVQVEKALDRSNARIRVLSSALMDYIEGMKDKNR